jgi:diadenosine tetraphosphate (Ap4A) HIT family hydrolase
MLLVIPKRHVTNEDDLTPEDWMQIGEILKYAKRTYGIPGGMFALRMGDPLYHVGTVPHMHGNYIVPNWEMEHRVPISKDPKDHAKNWPRLLEHIKELEQRGGLEWLFSQAA